MGSINGVLLFDGYCVLCSAFVRRLIKKLDAQLQVLAMQTPEGLDWLNRFGLEAEPDEVILLIDHNALKGVDAVLFLMQKAGGWWKFFGKVASWWPHALLTWLYRRLANNRYFLFGKRTTCYRPQL